MENKVKYFDSSLFTNRQTIERTFQGDSILRIREFSLCGGHRGCLFYFDGMVNVELVNETVLRPLMLADAISQEADISDFVMDKILYSGEIKKTSLFDDAMTSMMYGDTLLLFEGNNKALLINTKGWRTRGISEPKNERVLQGPREGFDEAAMFNVAMLRRRLQTTDFCAEFIRLGARTNTLVFICYLKSLVNRDSLRKLRFRLGQIDIDSVLDSHYITEQIRDNRHSFFETVGSTERPDIVAARLLEGRIALVVDSTPMVITLPYLFSENFQSDEDYYIDRRLASAGRILRILCFFIAVSLPALYIVLTTFHFDFLPTDFALKVASSRDGVPFSSLSEAFLIVFLFEILRETGVRMSESVSGALSIVGGLVIGQAAVEAKIVSAPVLIVVAASGICGLAVPRLSTAVFYMRLIALAASGLFGLCGYLFFSLYNLLCALSLTSLGVDATLSLKKPDFQGLKDVFFRADWRRMFTRPQIQTNDTVRKK